MWLRKRSQSKHQWLDNCCSSSKEVITIVFSRYNRSVTYNVWNKLDMSRARLWKARSYRRSEFSRVAKRDAWIISVCIWACLKNAFYGWTPSMIKFHRRAVERKYCLDQTHVNVGPSFLASWLAFFCDWCQKKTRKLKNLNHLRKLRLLNPSWWKINV